MTAQKGKDLLSTFGLWAVGDMTLAELVTDVPLILGGWGLAALGTKVDDAATKPCRSKAGSLN